LNASCKATLKLENFRIIFYKLNADETAAMVVVFKQSPKIIQVEA